jgi:hypothetical protein
VFKNQGHNPVTVIFDEREVPNISPSTVRIAVELSSLSKKNRARGSTSTRKRQAKTIETLLQRARPSSVHPTQGENMCKVDYFQQFMSLEKQNPSYTENAGA